MLQNLDPCENKKQLPCLDESKLSDSDISETAKKIIEITDAIISKVDQTQLLAYFGAKSDSRPDAAKIKR